MPFISRNCLLTSDTMAPAARPTAPIVSPQNRNAAIAPMNAPVSTFGLMSVTWKNSMKSLMPAAEGLNISPTELVNTLPSSTALIMAIFISSMYDASSARAVNAAEPIAKPLPVAAVVFPRASRASVLWRTSSPSPLISAFPPALSAIGP